MKKIYIPKQLVKINHKNYKDFDFIRKEMDKKRGNKGTFILQRKLTDISIYVQNGRRCTTKRRSLGKRYTWHAMRQCHRVSTAPPDQSIRMLTAWARTANVYLPRVFHLLASVKTNPNSAVPNYLLHDLCKTFTDLVNC